MSAGDSDLKSATPEGVALLDCWQVSGLSSRQGERETDAGRENVDATGAWDLRVKFECGRSDRAIAVAVSVARSTVQLCVVRFGAAGLTWPLPQTLTAQAQRGAWRLVQKILRPRRSKSIHAGSVFIVVVPIDSQ